MLLGSVKIGDRIEISKKEKSTGRSYTTKVESLLDKNCILIQMPNSYGKLVKLPIADNYSFLFFTEKAMISFDGSVLDYTKQDGFHMIIIKITSKGERIQRRDFYRFDCEIPFRFSVIDDSIDIFSDSIKEKMYDGIIKDIGGGGIRFISNDLIDEGVTAKSFIFLNDDLVITIGKILHKQSFPKSTHKYQYRIQFIGTSPSEQEKIVQYIYNEQRKTIKTIKK